MAYKLQIRRGLLSALPIGISGEPLFATDTNDLYISNGTTNQKFQKFIASGTSSQFLKGDGSLDSNTYYLASNPSAFIALSALSASAPLSYNNTTGVFTIAQSTGSVNGYLSSTDWTTFNNKQATLSLTTTGTSGAATLVGATLNIPQYADQFVGTVTSVSFTLGATGTDLSSSVANSTTTPAITLNVPTASASSRGALSAADWTIFNNKQATLSLTTTGTSGAATLVGTTLNVPDYGSALTGYVPYTGATGAVTLGAFSLTATGITVSKSAGVSTITFPAGTNDPAYIQHDESTPNTGIMRFSVGDDNDATDYFVFGNVSGGFVERFKILSNGIVTLGTWQATAIADAYISSAATWNAKQNAITLTTTGTSGAATLVGATLNIPQYADQFVGTVTSVAALTIGTTGTDLSSTVANGTTTPVITLQVPTASATNRGALSSADWTTFNNKQGTITLTTTGTSGVATLIANTLNIPDYGSALSGYLPLAGGIMTGQIVLKEGTISTDYTKGLRFPNDPYGGGGDTSGLRLYADTSTGGEAQILELYCTNDSTGASQDKINFSVPSVDFAMVNGNKIWNVGNLPSPQSTITLTTTGTSGAATFSANTLNIPNYTITNAVTGTGTTNYLPKWTSASAIGNSNVFDNGTNVGIGTTSPSYKLHISGSGTAINLGVVGNIRAGGTGTSGGEIVASGGLGNGNFVALRHDDTNGYITVTRTVYDGHLILQPYANVGIGTTSPAAKLHVDDGTGAALFVGLASNIYYRAFEHIWQSINGTFQRMSISSAGNLLLNTSVDSGFKFDCNGTARVTGAATFSSSVTALNAIINNGANSTDGIKIIASTTASIMTGGIEFMRTTVTGGSKIEPLRDAAIGGVGLNFLVTVNNTAEGNATYTSALQILNTGAATFSSSVTATSFIPSSATIPTNGMYLSAANTLDFATNSVNRLSISSVGAATFSSSVQTGTPTGGTAKPWKLGRAYTGTCVPGDFTQFAAWYTGTYIEIDVDGTLYKIPAITSNYC